MYVIPSRPMPHHQPPKNNNTETQRHTQEVVLRKVGEREETPLWSNVRPGQGGGSGSGGGRAAPAAASARGVKVCLFVCGLCMCECGWMDGYGPVLARPLLTGM